MANLDSAQLDGIRCALKCLVAAAKAWGAVAGLAKMFGVPLPSANSSANGAQSMLDELNDISTTTEALSLAGVQEQLKGRDYRVFKKLLADLDPDEDWVS